MDLGVSKNRGTRKSSILIGSSIIFTIHFGVPLFSETSNLFWEMFFSRMRRAHLLRKIWSLFSKKNLKNLPDFEDSGLQFRIGTYIIPGSKSLPARFRSIQGCISHIPSNEVPKHPKSCQIPGEFQVFWNTEKKNLPQEMLRGSFAPTHKVLGCVGYGIFTYIWLNCLVNVGKYTIHRMLLGITSHPFRNSPCNA